MGPIDAVKSGFRHFAGFSGRASRSEYWWWALFFLLAYVLFLVVNVYVSIGASYVVLLAVVALAIPSLAVSIRRLHDKGRSGWWYLLNAVPFGSLVILWWFCTAGDPLPNQYGPPPGGAATGAAPMTGAAGSA